MKVISYNLITEFTVFSLSYAAVCCSVEITFIAWKSSNAHEFKGKRRLTFDEVLKYLGSMYFSFVQQSSQLVCLFFFCLFYSSSFFYFFFFLLLHQCLVLVLFFTFATQRKDHNPPFDLAARKKKWRHCVLS